VTGSVGGIGAGAFANSSIRNFIIGAIGEDLDLGSVFAGSDIETVVIGGAEQSGFASASSARAASASARASSAAR
jgi:hypothetical protein